jgi:peptide/nickel transport system permease protein
MGSVMLVKILGRLLSSVVVIFLVLVFIFLVVQLAPGDPVSRIIGDNPSPDAYAQVRASFGLDQPIPVRLLDYLVQTLQGNLGTSFSFSKPVIDVILERVPNTLLLGGTALLIAVVIGVPLGAFAASRPGRFLDRGTSVLVVFANSVPSFWIGMAGIAIFAVTLEWLPSQGAGSGFTDELRHLIMPALTLALTHLALVIAIGRAKTAEMIHADFFLGARAKGLSTAQALRRHALRNALIPIITVIGYDFAQVLSGAILVETVFAWPGMGRLVYEAVLARDYPLVMGCVLIFTIAAVVINLVTDLLYLVLDPRLRNERVGATR